jgi:hypothetical protein
MCIAQHTRVSFTQNAIDSNQTTDRGTNPRNSNDRAPQPGRKLMIVHSCVFSGCMHSDAETQPHPSRTMPGT